jgi:hydrogenase maturation protease
VVGCEPANVDDRIGLSPVVDGAVDEAVRLVCDLVAAEVGVG